MAHLELKGLCKSYGAICIADSFSLDVPQAQVLGIIGPNGAGKSSLFNLISGDTRAESGSISFAGHNITGLPSRSLSRLGIGRTYQIPRPFGGMTVFENLLVAARFGGQLSVAGARKKCESVLETAQIADLADLPAGGLRLLDRKRLELARALVTEPKLLLLDEIAGGLTDAECVSLVALIGRLNEDGITILWIEHVLHALIKVAERIIAVNGGEIIADGTPEEVMVSKAVREIYLGSVEVTA